MSPALLLLRPALLTASNALRSASLIRHGPFALIGLGIWGVTLLGLYYGLRFIRGLEPFGDLIAMKLMSLIFFGIAAFLLLSGLITGISAFYLSRDLPLLRSKPLKYTDIAAFKAVESAVKSSWMTFAFLPTVFIAYGAVYEAPALFYLIAMLALVPYLLIPAGLGALLSHVLVRLFPAGRLRHALMALGLAVLVLAYFALQSAAREDTDALEGLFNAVLNVRTDIWYLPGFWMTQTLWSALRGGAPDFLFPLLFVSNAAFFLMAGQLAGALLYEDNLTRLGDASSRGHAPQSLVRFPLRERAFYAKDLRLFFRDPEQWSQLAVIGSLLLIYVYNFRIMPVAELSAVTPIFREAAAMLNVLLAGMVLTAVAARFLYVAVSLEGESFRLVRAAPVGMSAFLRGKLLMGFAPITALMLALVLLSGLLIGEGALLMAVSLCTVFMLCISVCGLAAGLGAAYPRFHYDSITSVSMGLGSVTFMLIAFLLVSATAGLEAAAFFAVKGGPPGARGYLIAGGATAVMLLLNALAFWLPLRAGLRRLNQDSPV